MGQITHNIDLVNKILEQARHNKSEMFKMHELEQAACDLKTHRSRDHEGLINELFKKDVLGSNLKQSILLMFNSMKDQGMIPSFMPFASITTITKNHQKSKLDLKNERGVFRVSILRGLLMRVLYNKYYSEIESNFSDCQMGA